MRLYEHSQWDEDAYPELDPDIEEGLYIADELRDRARRPDVSEAERRALLEEAVMQERAIVDLYYEKHRDRL